MGCNNCEKNDTLTEEARAVRGASEMAQRYKLLCGAVIALVIGFVIIAGCMVYAVTNAQRIANEAVLEALYTVSEMEVTTETTTTQTVEGDSATINNVDGEQYNDNAVNEGAGS